MTVGAQVKSCFAAIKSAEAILTMLQLKTQDEQTKAVYREAQTILNDIKSDLQQQIIFITREEPQYKQ